VDVHELTAAYALDALDEDERESYEAHLAHCDRCREELAGLSEAATALAWGAESPAPPERLRSRILEAAAAERENVLPLRPRLPWRELAAVAACAAVGLGIWAGTLSNSLDNERSASARAQQAVEIVSDPNARRVELRGDSGMVAVDRAGNGVLIVHRLAAAPADRTYEAWVIPQGGTPRKAGLFHGGGSMTMVPLDAKVPAGAVIAATIEHAGGVDQPTRTPLFTAQT
jgi:anti-sigma-K factor RskA